MTGWLPTTTGSPAWRLGLLAVCVTLSALVELSLRPALPTLAFLALAAVLLTPGAMQVWWQRLKPLLTFALVAILLAYAAPLPPGAPSLTIGGHSFPLVSLTYLVALWVKSALIVTWVTAFGPGLTERDVLEGLSGLHLPPPFVALCYLILHQVQRVTQEVRRLLRAQKARGRARGLRAVRVAAALAQVLVLRLGRRAERQALAMAARGFDTGLPLLQVRSLSAIQMLSLLLGGGLALWAIRF